MKEWIVGHLVQVRETASGFGVWLEDRLLAQGASSEGAVSEARLVLEQAKTSHVELVLDERRRDEEFLAVRENRREEAEERRRDAERLAELEDALGMSWREHVYGKDFLLEMELDGEPRSREVGLVRLRELARESYRDYLLTTHWMLTREAMFDCYGRRCNRCPSVQRLQIHHRTYVRLGCEWLEDLEVLCDVCHRAHHGVK